jgi:hypothetical protein
MNDADNKWLSRRAQAITDGINRRDTQAVVDQMCTVHQRYGEHGLYAICCALAEVVKFLISGGCSQSQEQFWSFNVVDEHGAAPPEKVGNELVVALRFSMAHLNDDTAQKVAIFKAPRTAEQAVQLPMGLVNLIYLFMAEQETDNHQ